MRFQVSIIYIEIIKVMINSLLYFMMRDEKLILILVYMWYDCNTFYPTSTETRSFSAGYYTSSYFPACCYSYRFTLTQKQNFALLFADFVRFPSA